MKKRILSLVIGLLLITSCTVFTTLVVKNKKQSFVQVLSVKLVKGQEMGVSTASGTVIKSSDDATHILTAGHFCLDIDPVKMTISPIEGVVVTNVDGDSYKGRVYAISRIWDLCIIETAGLGIPAVRVAKHDVKHGDTVVNIAAPQGLFGKDLVMSYDGKYAGSQGKEEGDIRKEIDFYSFPVSPGSSGSPIFNLKGELVGMVFAVDSRFHHISLAVTREQISMFLESALDLDYIEMTN